MSFGLQVYLKYLYMSVYSTKQIHVPQLQVYITHNKDSISQQKLLFKTQSKTCDFSGNQTPLEATKIPPKIFQKMRNRFWFGPKPKFLKQPQLPTKKRMPVLSVPGSGDFQAVDGTHSHHVEQLGFEGLNPLPRSLMNMFVVKLF